MSAEMFEYLEKHYFFRSEPQPGELFRFTWEELTVPAKAAELLAVYGSAIKAQGPEVTAAYFGSWLGGLCAALQYMISYHGAALRLTPDNLTFQAYPRGHHTAFAFLLADRESTEVPAACREEWRDALLRDFYGNRLRPLVEAVAAAAGVDPGHVWSAPVTRIHYAYDHLLETAPDEERRRIVEEDFHTLLQGLEGEWFGRKRNPLDVKFRYVENPLDTQEKWRIKASCCLAYRTDSGHGFCYTCPRLTAAQREEKKEAMLAAATS
ncbi:(2Fe-2S)-binding protein [Paenibacillus sp. S-38]|uniref:(2Fe-2S)-binding protein n=1 Tax=Paenibacillus sp. S-38 TaxID=3416710 RepID=UPI003CEC69F1